jgi:hypothetical protein
VLVTTKESWLASELDYQVMELEIHAFCIPTHFVCVAPFEILNVQLLCDPM